MKILILLFILVIVGSLFTALYTLVKDRGESDRTVKALTVRVAVSVLLFALLMAGFYFGLIPGRQS
ncbi:MAG TPA: twin transmembrane helix small protein [Burkholderiales bacterium]|nr:twin transmembrane helix small protein [Burkholderiales bacterium]